MYCTNCYNGCAEITSDQCVKYTGISIPELNISNGDTLLAVEQAIASFLVPVLIGEGIKPVISPAYICTTVRQYLPSCTECTGFTLNEVLSAIMQTICSLQDQVDTIGNTLSILNADYVLPSHCLASVTPTSGTHAILQAVIVKLCSLNSAFTTLVTTLPTTYVSISTINDYISAYLSSQNFLALAKDRMIPYTAVPYFGPISNYPNPGDSFNLSGAGSNYWEKVYLCNGNNSTPDLRGRTLVGATTGMGGGSFNPAVDPGNPDNPNYSLTTVFGANKVTLGIGEIPNHDHPSSSVEIVDNGHTHDINMSSSTGSSHALPTKTGTIGVPQTGVTEQNVTGITASLHIVGQGGGESHNNVQPSRGCYYIMYIP